MIKLTCLITLVISHEVSSFVWISCARVGYLPHQPKMNDQGSDQGRLWSEEMKSASDDDEEEEETEAPSFKRQKTNDSPKAVNGGQDSRPSPSGSRKRSGEC